MLCTRLMVTNSPLQDYGTTLTQTISPTLIQCSLSYVGHFINICTHLRPTPNIKVPQNPWERERLFKSHIWRGSYVSSFYDEQNNIFWGPLGVSTCMFLVWIPKPIAVILFSLHPAFLTHKNSQGHRMIDGLHLMGCTDRSINRSKKMFLKDVLFPLFEICIESSLQTKE